MSKGILGKKIGMTRIFQDGKVVPVTVIEAGPCYVRQIKTKEKDGYNAVQVGFSPVKEKNVNKPAKGHFGKAGVKPTRYLREFRVDDASGYEIGQAITLDIFADGEMVDVVGTSKGKGFQGNIKRHGFHRGPMAHGSKYHRGVGSLGPMGPARVFKGRPLPGRMGGNRVTVQNLTIAKVDVDKNVILVKGAIPGANKGLVTVKSAVKAR